MALLAAQALCRSPQRKSRRGHQDGALPRFAGPTLAAGFEATRPGRRRKWVYFIRHGEALVNAAGRVFAKDDPRKKAVRQDMQYYDSRLSEKGLEQARALRASVPKVDIVAASPLTRALQTATAVFGCDEPGGPKLHALEALREFCGKQYQPCDSRRPPEELQADFPHVDFNQAAGIADIAARGSNEAPAEEPGMPGREMEGNTAERVEEREEERLQIQEEEEEEEEEDEEEEEVELPQALDGVQLVLKIEEEAVVGQAETTNKKEKAAVRGQETAIRNVHREEWLFFFQIDKERRGHDPGPDGDERERAGSAVPPGADELLGPGKVESVESVDARIERLFTWLRDQPHEAVGCVAHFQILSRIFAEHLEPAGLDGSCYGPYANLEVRSVPIAFEEECELR
ncbi:hypothetical protein AK812_SmicGene27916 [Symbiodinium microadriaticum]|uniref:Uncharacterized protein n=1 Tax=Symbiodinium microadriaticum TaxID=2951 RepID=A0A1Q9D5P3_SYMMI|nr:hypothetical protein AK812_SmicGene27916 [Symbiodinium microadriaticum]